MCLLHLLLRASAKRVTAVIPYYGYRKNSQSAKSPTTHSEFLFSSASDVAKMLQVVGVERVIVVGLMDTKKQFLGWIDGHIFDSGVSVEVLDVSTIAAEYFVNMKALTRPVVIVTPRPKCMGAANIFRDQIAAARPDIPSVKVGAVLFGNRDGEREDTPNGWSGVEEAYEGHTGVVTEIIGDVAGCDVIILDESIQSGSTMLSIASNLKSRGANKVYGVVTHSLLTTEAWRAIQGKLCIVIVYVCYN